MVAVAVRDLDKSFGNVAVLKGINIDVPDGEFAVLVGPSGCGKSTLLRLLAGLESPTTGSIKFGDKEVSKLQPRDRDVAMVFQSYALYPHLTVRGNLGFGLKLRKEPPDEIAKRVAEVSEMLGLGELLDRMPKALSGGQRQRVAMGRAIVRRPSLFLFDEPLSNLDAALRAQVRVDIRKLHQQLGTTSVYVTHDQVEAMTLADVMFILHLGRVEQSGKPLELYQRPRTKFVAGFLGSPAMNFLDAAAQVKNGRLRLVLTGGKQEQAIELAGKHFTQLKKSQPVTLGIRPHELIPQNGEAPAKEQLIGGRLVLEAGLAEALGGETYVHGTIGDQAVVVRLDPSHSVQPGDKLELRVGELHLFDTETGKSLR